MQMQTLMKEIFKWHCPFNLPRHSAVDAKVDRVLDADTDVDERIIKWHSPFNLPGHSAVDAKVDRVGDADTDVDDWHLPGHSAVDAKVDRVGDADADVDHEDDVLGQVVVHELVQAAIV